MKIKYNFFFQAEDGIRDWSVTGVQTCALPISVGLQPQAAGQHAVGEPPHPAGQLLHRPPAGEEGGVVLRSEERRVGKECRSRRWPKETRKSYTCTQEYVEDRVYDSTIGRVDSI